ncbi:MAG: mannose-6-phosphate isomerase [Burkholderiales bacterium]|nr:mannose-6-phosphate isomerase [Opitutaceae bacterium]
MRQPLLPLENNRVRRNYAGGLCLDRWQNLPSPQDGPQPEDWLASTTPAINRGMADIPGEGLGRALDADGKPRFLADLFREHGEYYLGREHLARVGPQLGFLAKLLDSSMRLHTQVHPTREFAKQYLNSQYGKLECYVILAIRPGHPGNLRLGFQHAPTRAEWREIVATQDIARMDACFDPIPVAVGQVWWVPGAMVHALGSGLLLLEVMEPSDLVVRCEFEREGIVVPPEARYMGRDLDFCLDVFDYTQRSVAEMTSLCRVDPVILSSSDAHEETLGLSYAKTRCFEVRRLKIRSTYAWPCASHGRLVIVASGHGTARVGAQEIALAPGSRFFVAAASPSVLLAPTDDHPLELCVCQATAE